MIPTNEPIQLRLADPSDRSFLFRVFCNSNPDVESLRQLPRPMSDQLVEMQFEAQNTHYLTDFPGATDYVIESGQQPVGRLLLDRKPDEFHLVDIALLPECRNQGTGRQVMEKVLAEARKRNLPCRLLVKRQNPARDFYLKCGFEIVTELDLHFEMKCPPHDAN